MSEPKILPNRRVGLGLLIAAAATAPGLLSGVALQHSFANGDVANASEVNQNFSVLANTIEGGAPLILEHTVPNNNDTGGGIPSSAQWHTRLLNTQSGNLSNVTSGVTAGVFSLKAGTYYISGEMNVLGDSNMKTRVYNITQEQTLKMGINVWLGTSLGGETSALVPTRGVFTVANDTDDLAIQYYVKNASGLSFSLGNSYSVGDGTGNVWAQYEIRRVGD